MQISDCEAEIWNFKAEILRAKNKQQMKILFYNHTGKVSGAERIILLILQRLNRSRYSTVMVCPANDEMAKTVEKMGVPCRTIEQLEARFTVRPDKLLRYFASFYQTIKQLRTAVRREQPDLIHANSIRSGLVATTASVGLKMPVIWHLQDELPKHPLSTLIRLFAAFSSRTRMMPASQATGDSFRGKLLKTFGKHIPERVVHNAIELDDFRFDEQNRRKIRDEFNLSDDEFVFGIVGQITPRKGQLELLQTFARAREAMPAATLLVVGAPMFNNDYEYLEELKRAAHELGIENNVRFLGSRNDVAAVMQALDLLVVNSKSEALVVVAVEAMACRTPILATKVGGTHEIIEHGKNGWLLPLGDAEALKQGLVTLSQNPELRRQFADESEKIAFARLGAERLASPILKLSAKI
jgi:glycosyltransferase involved in cell wall biosynthesis